MITQRSSVGFDTLYDAIEQAKREGYSIEFVINERGFLDPDSGKTYLPESITAMEVIRIDAPYSEPDAQSILYLLQTVDGRRGWVSDAYGPYSNETLAGHLSRIVENFNSES
ncbi:MAG: hypothetical protein D6730_14965 [Bacteroidetes bacterium]|nr:MAG: hypothetical protein D6730_14965 [Bacteroidota bacterium]